MTLELAAILYDLGRQPRAAHDFFVRYQDRILFGKDTYAPTEFPFYWRVLETKDEYFDYYRDYHAFWNLYGMDLPDERAAEGVLPERAARDPRVDAERLAAVIDGNSRPTRLNLVSPVTWDLCLEPFDVSCRREMRRSTLADKACGARLRR